MPSEAEIDALRRLSEDRFAKAEDEHDAPAYLSVVEDGDRIFPVCVTHHTNGVADGEIIPNYMFERFVENGLEWVDEEDLPNDVQLEFSDIKTEVAIG